MGKKFLIVAGVVLLTLILVASALAASTSLGGRTITPQPAERINVVTSTGTKPAAYGKVFIQGTGGQQDVRMRFVRNGVASGEYSFIIPSGSTNYYVGNTRFCTITTTASTWVVQTRFASQSSWVSAPGRTLYC